jgi:hypothetical protein
MNIRYIHNIALAALITLCGCQSEDIAEQNKTAGFVISLSNELGVETKASQVTGDDLKEFTVTLTNTENPSNVTTHPMTNGSLITVEPGSYNIVANNKDNILAFDAPYYVGSTTSSITEGEQKTVTINCNVANAKATVVFANQSTFNYIFDSYKIEVKSDKTTTGLDWTDWKKHPFFSEGSKMTFTFKGIKKDSGEEKTFDIPVNGNGWTNGIAEAGKNYVITLKVTEVTSINLTIDTNVTVDEITEYIPLDWLPTPTVEVLPGNIWTKEFTIEPMTIEGATLDESKISYQWRLKGEDDWNNCNNTNRQKFEEQPSNRNIEVRTTYKVEDETLVSEVLDIQLEEEAQLPNSDMEEWSAEERGYYYKLAGGSSSPKLRVYYPWNDTKYWNTNNDFTTRYRDAGSAAFSTVYLYNSFPAVSYTKDSNSGTWAAELRNTAAGRGNTSSSKSSYNFNNVPGELFIGDITVTNSGTAALPNDSYTIEKGRSFSSKPTSVNFYYKYTPYNTDYWKVYVAIFDENDNILGEGALSEGDQVSTYSKGEVEINYTNLNAKPSKIYIYFGSSIYNGSELPYTSKSVTTWYGDSERTQTTLSGSIFTIDDISLNYEK